MESEFAGKVVWVSGAGRGFGRRVAEMLGGLGAKLVVTDLTDELVAGTVDALTGQGAQVSGLSGDIALEETSENLIAHVRREHGVLDIAINNAGIAQPPLRLHETDSALAQKIIAIDLTAVFFAMKQQIPLMLETVARNGEQCSILNVASAAGQMGSPMLAVYAAAKHGVVGITRSAAVEYGRKGIRVNCICPAFTKTEMVTGPLEESPHGRDKAEANMVAFNPMQRLGEVDEIVQAMVWAVSPKNSFFNGQALGLDGGLSA